MGCCGSTQAGDDDRPTSAPQVTTQQPNASLTSPLPTVASAASRDAASRTLQRHRTSPSPSRSPSRSSTPLRRPSWSSRDRPGLPSHERFNSPLVLPARWTSTGRTWTPAQLHRERAAFFDTRVTGRAEIWVALQNVCDLLRNGDIATSQGILDAAGITLPTGSLAEGCYDEAGNLYRLPEVVTSDPLNIQRNAGSRNSNNIDGDTMIGVPDSMVEGKVLDGGEKADKSNKQGAIPSIEEKGKATERDMVNVKCRLSDRGGPDVIVALGKTQHVSTLARRVQVEGKVSPSLQVRLAYLGKILNEKDTLDAQGWKEGHVINALVVGDIGT